MSDGRTPTGPDGQQPERPAEENLPPRPPQPVQPPQPGQQQAQSAQQQGQPAQPVHGQQPTWTAPQQPAGSQYRAPQPPTAQPSNPQQQGVQQPNVQQPNAQQPNAQQPNPYQTGAQPWWNQQQATPRANEVTQPYPTAPTQRFGAPVAPSTGQQGQQPSPQGYPVQYAAGPGQQHAATPGFGPYGQQPGSATAGSPGDAPTTKRRFSWGAASLGLLAGAAVGVLVTLAVTDQFVRPVFTGASVEDGVQGVLEDEFGLPDVRDVSCPEEPSAAAGAEFACAFTTGDREFSVQVRVLDSGGQYLVGAVTSGD
jgi:hypothetical protein